MSDLDRAIAKAKQMVKQLPPVLVEPTPTTDRDELLESLIKGAEIIRETDARLLNTDNIAAKYDRAIDRIQADAATIAAMRRRVELAPEPYEYMTKDDFKALPKTMQGFISAHRNWLRDTRAILKGGDHG